MPSYTPGAFPIVVLLLRPVSHIATNTPHRSLAAHRIMCRASAAVVSPCHFRRFWAGRTALWCRTQLPVCTGATGADAAASASSHTQRGPVPPSSYPWRAGLVHGIICCVVGPFPTANRVPSGDGACRARRIFPLLPLTGRAQRLSPGTIPTGRPPRRVCVTSLALVLAITDREWL